MRPYLLIAILLFCIHAFAQNRSSYTHIICKPDTVTEGTPAQLKIYVIIDSVPLTRNTLVKIFFPKEFAQFAFENNPPPFPLFPALQHGYCRSTGNNGLKASIAGIKLTRDEFVNTYPYPGYKHDDNEYLMTVQLDTTFNPGDTLIIIYGYGTIANYINVPDFSFQTGFKAMVDFDKTGNYVFQNSFASLTCVTKKANALELTLSSTGTINKPALLKAVVTDDNISIYPGFTGMFNVTCTNGSSAVSAPLQFFSSDNGHAEIPLLFSRTGIYTCTAQLINSNLPLPTLYPSNPINISNDSMQIYWGEFHTHTEYSRDGTGDDAFNYAKYGAALDFFAQTDHADGNGTSEYGIDSLEWIAIVKNVKIYNLPGRFVTFLGYEESMATPSGHYNLIFNAPDNLLGLVPNLPKFSYNTIQKIWTRLDNLDSRISVITIPHHTGKIFSIYPAPVCTSCNEFGGNYSNNKYKRLMEVYSGHGLSESYNPQHPLSYESLNATAKSGNGANYAQDGWALREKFGIIASSDNHLARATRKEYGAFAVIADSLERNDIFQNIQKRHTYATTGERIGVKFYINNHLMGEEFNLNCTAYPQLKFEVNGTDKLDYIEILKWDFKNGKYTSDHHPVFTVLKKYTLNGAIVNYTDSLVDGFIADSSMYYLRVKQKNKVEDREVWAWTSPVWVNTVRCDTIKKDTIIYFDAKDSVSGHQYAVYLKWITAHQVTAHHYIILRSNDGDHFEEYAQLPAKGNTGDTVSYTFTDNFADDSVLYYRIKLVTYFDSVILSRIDTVHNHHLIDSITAFHAKLKQNGVDIRWAGKEFMAIRYELMRSPVHDVFSTLDERKPLFNDSISSYTFLDELPLKDSSLYKVVMEFPDGTFKTSSTDTIYFIMDSVINFYTRLNGNLVEISWQGVHEQNTEQYEIQKSRDSIQFSTILHIPTKGHLFDTAYYVSYDTILLPGFTYYRISQTIHGDYPHYSLVDSQLIISTGIRYIVDNQLSIKIANSYFGEGESDLTVITNSGKVRNGNFMIVDVSGKLLYNQQVIIAVGEDHLIMPTAHLPSNIYFLLFKEDDIIIKNSFYILDEH